MDSQTILITDQGDETGLFKSSGYLRDSELSSALFSISAANSLKWSMKFWHLIPPAGCDSLVRWPAPSLIPPKVEYINTERTMTYESIRTEMLKRSTFHCHPYHRRDRFKVTCVAWYPTQTAFENDFTANFLNPLSNHDPHDINPSTHITAATEWISDPCDGSI